MTTPAEDRSLLSALGLVIVRSAECERYLSVLLVKTVGSDLAWPLLEGAPFQQLCDNLNRISESIDSEVGSRYRELVTRARKIQPERDRLVHGLWMHEEFEAGKGKEWRVAKVKRLKGWDDTRGVPVAPDELVALAQKFHDLRGDIIKEIVLLGREA